MRAQYFLRLGDDNKYNENVKNKRFMSLPTGYVYLYSGTGR